MVASSSLYRPRSGVKESRRNIYGGGGGAPSAVGTSGAAGGLDDSGKASADFVLLLLVMDDASFSSGIVANFLSTCFSAGRRIGLLGCLLILRPPLFHSQATHLRNISMPES